MKRLIIVGSPRPDGRSAHLAEMLFEANIDEHPEDELFLVPVSEVEIAPCIGCGACCEQSNVILKGDDGKEVTVKRHRCVFDDDMQTLYDLIDDADQITVVSPIYFSGAPALLKCLLDRLQPYYWANVAKRKEGKGGKPADKARKRPAELHVIGEGGDPHGYDALVSETRSALAVAGFRLERILDWVGKIDDDGEITAEAQVLLPASNAAASSSAPESAHGAEAFSDASESGGGAVGAHSSASAARGAGSMSAKRGKSPKSRPKLDLSSTQKKTRGKAQGKVQGKVQGKSQKKGSSRGK